MDGLNTGELQIEIHERPESIECRWTGRSSERNPAQVLVPFFSGVLTRAGEAGAPVEMRFEALEHFNSSTVTALIKLIQEARSREVKLVIVYDQKLKWQKLSFDALQVFVRDDGLLELRTV